MNSPWIPIAHQLPPPGIYVLVHLTKDNWIDSSDQTGVYFKVAKMVVGISREERSKMKAGDLPNPEIGGGYRRADLVDGSDEWGNNQKPFHWDSFGPSKYFGQEVDYWMPIPKL